MKSLTERLFERMDGKDVYDTCKEYYMQPSSTERLFNDMGGGRWNRVNTGNIRLEEESWSQENIVKPQREVTQSLFDKMSR